MLHWLLTVVGEDQPELQQKFCGTIGLMEGIFLDSQQTVMAGNVMAMYRICLPRNHLSFARKMFDEFEEKGLDISIKTLPTESLQERPCLILNLRGQYRFSIDHDIRMILESHGAVIEHLNQSYLGQVEEGEYPFSAKIRAQITQPISKANLLQALYRLAPRLLIDLNITDMRNEASEQEQLDRLQEPFDQLQEQQEPIKSLSMGSLLEH